VKGIEKELIRLEKGDCFGELAILLNSKRTASVYATCDTYLLVVDSQSF